MTKIILAAVLFILLLPFAYAFNCSLTADPAYCQTVLDNDTILGALLYSNSTAPDHDFVRNYNLGIEVTTPPNNTLIYQSKYIKDAWLSFLAIFPSVIENNTLYVPSTTSTLCEYNYRIELPSNYYSSRYPQSSNGDCKRTYSLKSNTTTLKILTNNVAKSQGKYANITIIQDSEIKSNLEIDANVKIDRYRWYTYCCGRDTYGSCTAWCHQCRYSTTQNDPDSVIIEESKLVKLYTLSPYADLQVYNAYYGTTKGRFYADNYSTFKLAFNNSFYTEQKYYYDIIFDKKPYYFITLEAHPFNSSKIRNMDVFNTTFVVKDTNNCSLYAYNHLSNFSSGCDLSYNATNLSRLSVNEVNVDLSFLLDLLIFILIAYIIYKVGISKASIAVVLILFLAIPAVHAEDPPKDECGITNLASCIPEKLYEYFLIVINSPLLPMLEGIKSLMTADISIDIFYHVWSTIRYILSFFYIFFFLYAGFVFLTSNANPVRRAQAKDLLKNIVIMIVLIQASFYLYGLILSLGSIMNNAILSMVDPHFFMLTVDNIANIGLELLLFTVYALVLFLTMILLVMRYIIVSLGVVLFPIGLFCYFTPPIKSYGKFILNMLGLFIFIAFFDLLIILACSMLIEVPVFANFKMFLMITCFGIVDYTLYLVIKFAMSISSGSSIKDDLSDAAKYIALLA